MVDHKALEYVRGEVYTNNIESFWSLLKRGVIGTYHNICVQYLPRYLNEFRFNNRIEEDIFGKAIAGCRSMATGGCFRARIQTPANRFNWNCHCSSSLRTPNAQQAHYDKHDDEQNTFVSQ
jgi:hypothetical protein